MEKLSRGLYEVLVTQELEGQLGELGSHVRPQRSDLPPDEAPDRIALHLGQLLRRAIGALDRKQRSQVGLALASEIIQLLNERSDAVDSGDRLSPAGDMLRAIAGFRIDGTAENVVSPLTPLLDTTLLTHAPGEPRLGVQLQSELPSADRIDVLMAFVRRTGIRPLTDQLRNHVQAHRSLRLLTTTYTGSTELAALQELRDLGADVRVSYDTSTTRLHAKAWLFHRNSGYSTAYIGSSNLTHSAMVPGMEWNIRVSGARNPDVIDKFSAVFDSYWNNGDFRPFDEAEFRDLTRAPDQGPRIFLSPVELRPEPFQARMLELLELSRVQGHHRNLLVSATGTGKTVMAALDYQRLRARLPRARLLFVAHRKELLDQSQATFRHALRDLSFGERWVDGDRPTEFNHVFASIQSLSATGIANLPADHFDVVIVDEFHHAAAKSYDDLLRHLTPRELLGLTATPERGDEEPILHWFDDRIAAELRLWDAIDQHRLCPFTYYGIADGTDYRPISWRRGRGYDLAELSNLVSADHVLARRVVAAVQNNVPEPEKMRALGFCVSVKHAVFMAAEFRKHGLPSVAVSGASNVKERAEALTLLATGRIRVVFSVDLFNEGVDIPSVDTLLMLRPTDSATLFLQQLGRGLRREVGKTTCTVLDFVGQHRKEFQFHRRYGALLGGSRKSLIEQITAGFPFLPNGCHMQLDSVAARVVLDNIRMCLPVNHRQRTQELQRVADSSGDVRLKRFIDESGLTLEDIYSGNHCWSDLLEAAGLATMPVGPKEKVLRRAIGRLIHINDSSRIESYRKWGKLHSAPDIATLELRDRRLMHMLLTVVLESADAAGDTLGEAATRLWQHPQILSELEQLMEVLADRVDHLQSPLTSHPNVPMSVHARYTRREMLAAFADGERLKTPEWREGARWLSDHRVDLLAFTLDKSTGHFSPTTRYRDYAISRELLHWESQSTTRANSPTGQRYQSVGSDNGMVLPFARLTTDEAAFWLLGPATYVDHQGERPMAITWKLSAPIPGDLFSSFAAAVV